MPPMERALLLLPSFYNTSWFFARFFARDTQKLEFRMKLLAKVCENELQ